MDGWIIDMKEKQSIPVKRNTSYRQPPNKHPKNGATIGTQK